MPTEPRSSAAPVVETAVAVPADGTFFYRVPPELADRIGPGLRVLVPFGRRRVTAYVLGPADPDAVPDGVRLKDVASILDQRPLFGPAHIRFFRFVSWYYHYPLGLVISEALPAGLKTMSRRRAVLTPAGQGALADAEADLDPDDRRLLARLDRPRGVAWSSLSREKPSPLARLGRLENRGLVETDDVLDTDRVRPQTARWLRVADQPPDPPPRLGPQEKKLLSRLEAGGAIRADDLKGDFPSLGAMIPRLADKGAIEVEERAVYRDALGRALDFAPHWPELTDEQHQAADAVIAAVEARTFAPFVLYGVTGSGKTEVYLTAMRAALEAGRTVLFLVPEIALTPAVEGWLRSRFDRPVAVLHSALSDGQRYDQWRAIRDQRVRIVLGARSAVFAPLDDLGLVVVDEEHDGAYKQEDKLRYQARDLAVYRAKQAGAAVVLGSATPSLESFEAAGAGRYQLLTLTRRIGEGRLPEVRVIDMRLAAGKRKALTPMLKTALTEALEAGGQALLFINRRGLASLPLCLACGHVLNCLNCSVSLTQHQRGDATALACHYCGLETDPPAACPQCGSGLMKYLGVGTEKLEAEVQNAFPRAKVARLDADTARPKGELTRILTDLRNRNIDVLVGTQMITKGHDFPGITLVGVIEADLGLHLPDFRAAERTFQLLAQVGGRAGRGRDPGRVLVQTFSPEHYALIMAKKHDYLSFFEEERAQRLDCGYPPFGRLILARFSGGREEETRQAAEDARAVGRRILEQHPADVELIGPAPSALAKIKNKYRFQLLLRSAEVGPLHRFTAHWLGAVRGALKGSGVSVAVDVDPYHMM